MQCGTIEPPRLVEVAGGFGPFHGLTEGLYHLNGHLGDIGVPVVDPMDFSAWIEVFLDGGWHAFDPRNNRPRIGRIVIARGRDAADVPLVNSFGPHILDTFNVWTHEVAG